MKKHNSNKNRVDEINDILKKEVLDVIDIALLAGISRDRAQTMRRKIINKFSSTETYSSRSPVRTDHFLKYYQSDKFNELYRKIFDISSIDL